MNEFPNTLIDENPIEINDDLAREPRRRQAKKMDSTSIIILVSIAVLWIGLVAGGYWFASSLNAKNLAYIDAKIEEQFRELQPKINEISAEADKLKNDLLTINQMLASTGELIGGTDTNKLALEQRINELNAQLGELQQALERLQDATSN